MNRQLERRRTRALTGWVSAVIFLWMLALNLLTPYICDDYTYRLNFATAEPLGSVLEILPSMAAHSTKMNGRLISHGLAQLFMLLPPAVFDLVNSAMFLLTLLLAIRLSGGKIKAGLLAVIFCLLWVFTPVLGQVALWQVGAANYLWALTAFLIFIAPELLFFRENRRILTKPWHWALFFLYAFFFGWYNEIASFVGICMVFCLLLLGLWMNREKLTPVRFLPLVFAAAGYLVMLSAPAQSTNKQAVAMTLTVLLGRFVECAWMLVKYCAPLLVLLAVVFVLGLRARLPRKTLVLSGLFALAGVCANFMPMAASYYPERCMCTTVLLLAMAVLFPGAQLLSGKKARIAVAVIVLLTLPALFLGGRDVLSCHRQFRLREQTIAQALADGVRDVTANVVQPQTPWSAFYGVRDLSTEDSQTWPNRDMARYYGIDSILGE